MDCAQVGVYKQTIKVSFCCLLQCYHRFILETKISLVVLRYLANKTFERKLSNQEISRLLVLPDLTQCNCTWTASVRLFDTTSNRSAVLSCLGGEPLACKLVSCGGVDSGLLDASGIEYSHISRFTCISRTNNQFCNDLLKQGHYLLYDCLDAHP